MRNIDRPGIQGLNLKVVEQPQEIYLFHQYLVAQKLGIQVMDMLKLLFCLKMIILKKIILHHLTYDILEAILGFKRD